MIDIFRNVSDQALQYRSPLVKVVGVNVQSILCLSDPTLTGYGDGSHTDGGDMMEEDE